MTIQKLVALTGVLALSASVLAQTGTKEQPKKDHPEHPKAEHPAKSAEKDIVDTAMGTGMHGTLCAALKAADWVAPLKEKGPFTVFAPTDEAFKKQGDKVAEWLKPENKAALGNILKYHVIKGAAVKSGEVVKMKESAATVQGSKITIAVKDGKVMLNGNATVTKADVVCSNGVIHVIDTVLMPPADAKKSEGEGKKEEKKGG